jgi:hypothetical protein
MASKNTEVNIQELQNVMLHIIAANKVNSAKGLPPVAANIVGPAGLGKTSAINQVGQMLGYPANNVTQVNMAEMQEIGDLIGLPVEEYKMVCKKGDVVDSIWVREKAIDSYKTLGYVVTTDSRMAYSEPQWIKGKKGAGILILDDYTRAAPQFTQAVMNLISTQKYMTWELPKDWTILLSSNPDDGIYTVAYQDPAQQSRYLNLFVKFDAEVWAEWAVKSGIDSRCINFVLMTPELIDDKRPEVNPRSISMFFSVISTFQNFEQNLELIQMLGEGSLGSEAASMFTSFIHNKMDMIISPDKIFDLSIPFANILSEINNVCSSGTTYRADIANVLMVRVANHLQHVVQKNQVDKVMIQRVVDLIDSKCLGADLRFVLTRKLVGGDDKWNDLLLNNAIYQTVME